MPKIIELLRVEKEFTAAEKNKVILGNINSKSAVTAKDVRAAYDEIITVCTKKNIPLVQANFVIRESDLTATAVVCVNEMTASNMSSHMSLQMDVSSIKQKYGLGS